MSEELEHDGYPIKHLRAPIQNEWSNPFTWSTRYRFGILGTGFGVGASALYNATAKRPWFGNLLPNLFVTGLSAAIAFGIGVWKEKSLSARDAIIDRYVALHPDDFEHLDPKKQRKYADIILPWKPVRVYNRTPVEAYPD